MSPWAALKSLTGLAVGFGLGHALGIHAGDGTAGDGQPVAFRAYRLPVRYGGLGPRLLAAGAIDPERLAEELERRGTPMSRVQREILQERAEEVITIDRDNSLFLLDLFWALGLTNRNPILTEGPLAFDRGALVGRYASTAGWTLGARPSGELFASTSVVSLTPEEQKRLTRVAQAVYRPCCDNPTYFPDCNHGMAMLGMLTVLAAGGADDGQMFAAAAAANSVWYPRQYREIGLYLEAVSGTAMAEADPRRLVGREVASGSGFRAVHAALAAAALVGPPAAEGVSAC